MPTVLTANSVQVVPSTQSDWSSKTAILRWLGVPGQTGIRLSILADLIRLVSTSPSENQQAKDSALSHLVRLYAMAQSLISNDSFSSFDDSADVLARYNIKNVWDVDQNDNGQLDFWANHLWTLPLPENTSLVGILDNIRNLKIRLPLLSQIVCGQPQYEPGESARKASRFLTSNETESI